jgi:hypothetical protein
MKNEMIIVMMKSVVLVKIHWPPNAIAMNTSVPNMILGSQKRYQALCVAANSAGVISSGVISLVRMAPS